MHDHHVDAVACPRTSVTRRRRLGRHGCPTTLGPDSWDSPRGWPLAQQSDMMSQETCPTYNNTTFGYHVPMSTQLPLRQQFCRLDCGLLRLLLPLHPHSWLRC